MTTNETPANTIQLNVFRKGNITIRQEKEGADEVWLQIGNEKLSSSVEITHLTLGHTTPEEALGKVSWGTDGTGRRQFCCSIPQCSYLFASEQYEEHKCAYSHLRK